MKKFYSLKRKFIEWFTFDLINGQIDKNPGLKIKDLLCDSILEYLDKPLYFENLDDADNYVYSKVSDIVNNDIEDEKLEILSLTKNDSKDFGSVQVVLKVNRLYAIDDESKECYDSFITVCTIKYFIEEFEMN